MGEIDADFAGGELNELNEKVLTFRLQNIEKRLHDVSVAVSLLKQLETKVASLEKRLAKLEDSYRRGVILDR